tara:strand:+ start:1707 stop:2939 length:1233 start_codon:yes stop_codon:yes gene_type:complete
MKMKKTVIIVGGGQAACSCAFKLRELGYDGQILIISSELSKPYHRPPLSKKYLLGSVERNNLEIKSEFLYQSQRIDVLLGTTVTEIDRDKRQVVVNGGRRFTYQTLVLATGANARELPEAQGGGASNVLTLRTLDDADRLRPFLKKASSLLVVGGGYIGLEMAAVARSLGLNVTLIELSDRILNRVASAKTAHFFKSLHCREGVVIHENTSIVSVTRQEGKVVSAELSNGVHIDVDFIVAGIGVTVNTSLALRAGLETGLGIEVDEAGRTSDPAIYSAGDCASFEFRGLSIRLESIQNAVDQADSVAQSIVNPGFKYRPLPWFWSDQYDTKLQTAGLNTGYTKSVFRPSTKRNDAASVWYFDDKRLLAVDAINEPSTFMIAKALLKEEICLDAETLSEVDNIRSLLPMRN